ncbi:hypothetical protein NPIL_85261 [Nephila pilipes]|uniref:Uncharacterized protein n=1 Tax=Nephila pilipes TaxID=299642 RepID=A0A8X6QDJ5_NEPPI|nr:hypothetical protein NPIL_85261 [Nephila pilipes]
MDVISIGRCVIRTLRNREIGETSLKTIVIALEVFQEVLQQLRKANGSKKKKNAWGEGNNLINCGGDMIEKNTPYIDMKEELTS